jgi:hypothetical protein
MSTPKAVTVKVKNPEHCIKLQNYGWAIGVGDTGAFGWKFESEVTIGDLASFKIEEVAA